MSKTLIPIDIGRSRPYMLEISAHEVPMHNLPESLDGFTFVHLTDLHGGYGATDAVYEEAVVRVNALKPDMILLTGDYVDDHAPPDGYPIDEVLRRFHARQGLYGSYGNHDHRRGLEGSHRLLERAGVHILNNENLRLESGLWLAAVDDCFEGKPDLERALDGLPDDRSSILLSHSPQPFDRIGDRDVLMLSGHTHGAQVVIPFPTPKQVCWWHLRCRQVAGWYRRGRTRLYLSRGLGVTGVPFRYNCPAEIAVFRLVPDTRLAPQRHRGTEETGESALTEART